MMALKIELWIFGLAAILFLFLWRRTVNILHDQQRQNRLLRSSYAERARLRLAEIATRHGFWLHSDLTNTDPENYLSVKAYTISTFATFDGNKKILTFRIRWPHRSQELPMIDLTRYPRDASGWGDTKSYTLPDFELVLVFAKEWTSGWMLCDR